MPAGVTGSKASGTYAMAQEIEGDVMANFKRKKSKRTVKCTICTKYRWRGNSKARKRIRDLRQEELSPGKEG